MTDERKKTSPGPSPMMGTEGCLKPTPPTVRPSPDAKIGSTSELAAEFAAIAAMLEPLKGPVPAEEDGTTWRRRVMSKAKPRLQALIKMTDTHPSAPEPLQSAFLMSRYSAMNIAASMTNWRSYSTPGLDCFDLLCEEPDTTAHLVKYGDQPGVAAAVATYAEWRATMAELGAAALAFIVESRAELAR